MANSARNKPGTEVAAVTEEDNSKVLENIQSSYESNKKRINTILTIVLVAGLGYFGYKYFYLAPNEEKASLALYHAEKFFQKDSVGQALNGNNQHIGFLKIIKKYGSTPSGNLANYYAGVCYLKQGDFKNAVKYLEDFNGKGTKLGYLANGCLGDAYMEMNNTSKGIEYYTKAASDKKDEAITPLYLYRLAVAYEISNKQDDAKKTYQRIKDEYPAYETQNIEKSLARLGVID